VFFPHLVPENSDSFRILIYIFANKLHLLRRTQHRFVLIAPTSCALHVSAISQATIRHVNTKIT